MNTVLAVRSVLPGYDMLVQREIVNYISRTKYFTDKPISSEDLVAKVDQDLEKFGGFQVILHNTIGEISRIEDEDIIMTIKARVFH